MSLREEQSKFAHDIGLLIIYAYALGYEITLGDGYRPDRKGHKIDSNHYIKLAQDINLFKDGEYLTKTEDHKELGRFWKTLDKKNRWGGDFKNKDGNHYSREWKGRA